MQRSISILKQGLIWGLFLTLAGMSPNQVFAQKKKDTKTKIEILEKGDKQDEVLVEVVDGVVFVDGKEVAKVNTEGRKVRVRSGNKGDAEGLVWFNGSENGEFRAKGNVFAFKNGNMEEGVSLYGSLDREALGDARIRSRVAPLHKELLELSQDGNAFAVYSNGLSSFGNGETMKMDMRSRELAMKIRSSDGDTSEMEAELDGLLNKIFTEKQQSHQERVDGMREELQALEQKLADRKSNRSEIIAKRKKDLLGTKDRFDW